MPGLRDGLLQRPDHETAHQAGIAKTHLRLGGMHVHVDGSRWAADVEGQCRMPVGRQHVCVGAAHGAEQELVAYRAAIDHHMYVGGGATVIGRQRCESVEHEALALRRNGDRVGCEIRAEQLRQPVQECVGTRALGHDVERARGDRPPA